MLYKNTTRSEDKYNKVCTLVPTRLTDRDPDRPLALALHSDHDLFFYDKISRCGSSSCRTRIVAWFFVAEIIAKKNDDITGVVDGSDDRMTVHDRRW